MGTITGLVCELYELQAAGEGGGELSSNANASAITTCLQQLLAACQGPEVAQELEDVAMDLFDPLTRAAAASPEAEAAAKGVLVVVGAACAPREVVTLTLAALAEGLGAAAAGPAPGLGNPAFQLFLLRLLGSCLQRDMRRWVAHLSDALGMLLRWAEATLLLLPTPQPPPAADDQSGALELAAAVDGVAELLEGLARCVGEQSGAIELAPSDREAALALLTHTVLQLAAASAQLPAVLERGAGALMAAAGAAPAIGPRLPLLAGPAAAASWPAGLLLRRCLPPLGVTTLAAMHLEPLSPGGEGCDYFSRRKAAQGAALAVCLACVGALPGLPPLSPADQGGGRRLLLQLAGAVPEVVDLAAGVQSVALTLLPLCALEAAGRAQLATPGAAPSSAALAGAGQGGADISRLVALLVLLMTQHPVELLRSCAHEALHAVLDCLPLANRLAILSALVQERMAGNQAAAAVALQRLRLEVERAWPARAGAPAASPFLGRAVTELAAAVLVHSGGEGGWAAEEDIAGQGDALGAAATLYRFVLLKEAGSTAGPGEGRQGQRWFGDAAAPSALEPLLRQHLAPLQRSVARQLAAGGGEGGGGSGGLSLDEQSRMGMLRLEEVLGCLAADIHARLAP